VCGKAARDKSALLGEKLPALTNEESALQEEGRLDRCLEDRTKETPSSSYSLPPLNQPPPPLHLPPPPPPPLSLLPQDPSSVTYSYPALPPPPVEHVRVPAPDFIFRHPPPPSFGGSSVELYRYPSSTAQQHFCSNLPRQRLPVRPHFPRAGFNFQAQRFFVPTSTRPSCSTSIPLKASEDITALESHLPSSVSNSWQKGGREKTSETVGHKGKTSKPLVIKEYKPTGPAPQFIPRQLSKKPPSAASVRPHLPVDPVIEELKRNALVLGAKPQGPTLPSDEEKKRKAFVLSETGSPSLDGTVKAIREKVAQVNIANMMCCFDSIYFLHCLFFHD